LKKNGGIWREEEDGGRKRERKEKDVGDNQPTEWSNIVGTERRRQSRKLPKGRIVGTWGT
jgi:hypothetical protein